MDKFSKQLFKFDSFDLYMYTCENNQFLVFLSLNFCLDAIKIYSFQSLNYKFNNF